MSSSAVKELSMWQMERLCNIVYLRGILGEGEKVKQSVKALLPKLYQEVNTEKELPCSMTKQQWITVLDSINGDSLLLSLIVADKQETKEDTKEYRKGQRAVCFADSRERMYVIYRGTHGDSEWLDNAEGMLVSDTIQQKAALNYLLSVKERYKPRYLAVAGHSKGGNKAQYITLTAPKGTIDYGLSIDGQGFSLDFVKKYQENIMGRKNLFLIAEQRDIVNALGFYVSSVEHGVIRPTSYYRGYRGFMGVNDSIYGCSLPYFHCPDALRIWENQIPPVSGAGEIPLLVNQLICSFLTSDIYSREEKKKTAEFFVGYCMENPMEVITPREAWLNLGMELVHLVATDNTFLQRIENLLYLETNLIFGTLFQNKNPSEIFQWGEKEETDVETRLEDSIEMIWNILQNSKRIGEILTFLKKLAGLLKKVVLRCFELVEGIAELIVIALFVIQLMITMLTKALHGSRVLKELIAEGIRSLKTDFDRIVDLMTQLEKKKQGTEEGDLLKLAKAKMRQLLEVWNS